jgi:CheY-like chemotaxis protein
VNRVPLLAVDDNPRNLRLLRRLLEGEGYEVRTAGSAEEALEVLRGWRPRVVLLDIQLPGMDGYELTRRIRADPALGDLPVVAVTSFAMADDGARAVAAGCDAWVAKPIDTRTFPAIVKRFVAGRRPAEEKP